MTRIIVQSQVGADGILRLAVPVGPAEANHAVKVTIEHLDIHNSLNVSARLDELKSLQNGWMDGEGLALAPELLSWLQGAFDKFYGNDLPPPHIYPTLAGGVRAEWSFEPHEVSLEIDLYAFYPELAPCA